MILMYRLSICPLNICLINHCFQATDLYYIGVILAVTSCLAGGILDVLIAKCGNVSTTVLVNWSAIAGFVMAVVYCQIQGSSYILSPRILSTTWTQWATYIGKTTNIFQILIRHYRNIV